MNWSISQTRWIGNSCLATSANPASARTVWVVAFGCSGPELERTSSRDLRARGSQRSYTSVAAATQGSEGFDRPRSQR